ncbi:hypothetical protein LDL76_04780 [Salegentibacter mishustinae]|uniref:hypothetical protein n=1 Tax=Salegentibacter mishustinae TaxID=270918 RepID=UPI001CE18D44|nr:hypothetical protein [Salegentibacter mishustinae]UBZ08028.1 hypothetical protein LDL76_04780 [Salegentibacter mishustinae]
MKIEQVDEIKKGFFQALENEKIAGKVEYTWAGTGSKLAGWSIKDLKVPHFDKL